MSIRRRGAAGLVCGYGISVTPAPDLAYAHLDATGSGISANPATSFRDQARLNWRTRPGRLLAHQPLKRQTVSTDDERVSNRQKITEMWDEVKAPAPVAPRLRIMWMVSG